MGVVSNDRHALIQIADMVHPDDTCSLTCHYDDETQRPTGRYGNCAVCIARERIRR